MYQIRCDDYILYDPRDEDLIVQNPKCKLKENTVGEGSFTILSDHPYYDKLKKLKSVFEIQQDGRPIFRGRMTGDSRDFNNRLDVDLEGILGFTNDTLIPPFNFPADFPEAENSPNVVEYFLGWILNRHNERVEDWQKLRLGNVTVSDPNNYLSRSSDKYASTWETLKTKLFDSALGGYLTIRYEADGNYVDYLGSYELTNTQRITLGENLLNIKNESDASETYSAILPMGKDGLTLESLADGDITEDLVKDGLYIYSKSAVKEYGWICVPVNESTWSDVTVASNLRSKAVEYLGGTAMLLSATITIKAVDLHFTDEEIQSFRVYRNILVDSPVHGITGASYRLSELDIDLMNPQNTVITIGDSFRSLVDVNDNKIDNAIQKIESTTNDLKDKVSNVEDKVNKIEGIDGVYFYVMYSQYANGQVMTDTPDETTIYMGTCSTNETTAPIDPGKYTWCKIRGNDGVDGKDGKDGKDGTNGTPGQPGENGKSQYFHVKYSDDGKTFTSNNGETLGDWMGTCVNEIEVDPIIFDDYTWKKIVGEDGQPGIDGADGKDGSSSFFYVKFSANSNGYPMTETPTSTTKYMGVCSTTSTTAPTSYSAYKWTQCRGNDGTNGTPGTNGKDGKTQYLHIKYSDDGLTFTGNNGEDLGAWIGTLVDFNEADSSTFSDYTWKKFTEDVDEELENIRQTVKEQYTSVINTADEIVLSALSRYVETSNYEEFRQAVTSQLEMIANEISMKFTTTTEQIENVGGDLQSKFEQLYKYISFSGDTAITIGSGDNSITLEIDNLKGIVFKKNGVSFGRWDGNNFYTGNIVVEVNERAQFGNFAFVPRSDGSLSLLKVGG